MACSIVSKQSENFVMADPNLDPLQQQQQMGTPVKDAVVKMAADIVAKIDQKPQRELYELNNIIAERFEELHKEIAANREEFYVSCLKATMEKMPTLKDSLNHFGFLLEVFQLQRLILVKFFLADLESESLAELVSTFFVCEKLQYIDDLKPDGFRKDIGIDAQNELAKVQNETKFYQEEYYNQETSNPWLMDRILSSDQKRLVSELVQRRALDVGDKVDALYVHSLTHSDKVSHWMPATIIQMAAKTDYLESTSLTQYQALHQYSQQMKFYIKFDGMPDYAAMINRGSHNIAVHGTYTDDFQWRNHLKEGDLVDSVDPTGTWYRATVLAIRESLYQETERYLEAKIGFRYYDNENGNKEDQYGHYIGWGSLYDEWIPVASPRIQRIDTVSHFYKVTGNKTMVYDDINVKDSGDHLVNSKEIKVWAKQRNGFFWSLKFPAEYFNEFGELGGFEGLLKVIATLKSQSITHLMHLMSILSKSMPLWVRQFAVNYIKRLRVAFEKTVTSTDILRKFKYDHYLKAMESYEHILRRHYPSSASCIFPKSIDDNYHKIMSHLGLVVSSNLINAEKLDTRVSGIREITQKLQEKSGLSSKEKLQLLIDKNVVDSVFEARKSHVQLLQRGIEILRFMIDQNAFKEQEINIVWSSTQKGDQQSKLEFYKLLELLQIKLDQEGILIFINLFATKIKPQEFLWQEIECVSRLTQFVPRTSQANQKACELLWDIACQVRPYPKQIIRTAIEKLMNLLKAHVSETLLQFLRRSFNHVEGHSPSGTLSSIKIIKKLFTMIKDKFEENERKFKKDDLGEDEQVEHIAAKDAFNAYFKECGKLVTLLIEDLARYCAYASTQWQAGVLTKENVSTLEMQDMPYTHSSNIKTRLKMIQFVLKFAEAKISAEQLDQIWEVLSVKSSVPIDQQLFFEQFKQWLSDGEILREDHQVSFFERNIVQQASKSFFKNLNREGLQCIQTLFLSINREEQRIRNVVNFEKQGFANVKKEYADFEVLVPPSTLRGIELIWAIFQECDKQNLTILAPLIDLISKIHNNLSPYLQDQAILQSIYTEYARNILQQIHAASGSSQSDEDKTTFVRACIILLKTFLAQTEKKGTTGLRSLHGLERGDKIEKIILESKITLVRGIPDCIEVNAFSNMTVWELKQLAAQHFKVSPKKLEFKRSDNNNLPKLNELAHSKLLRDMKVANYEIITVKCKPQKLFDSGSRKTLLNENGELVADATAIFTQWFEMFSEDGYMLPGHAVDFMKYVQGQQNMHVEQNNATIQEFYIKYDSDRDGRITLEDFLNFYKLKSRTNLETVWTNLTKGGFGSDLKPINLGPTSSDTQDMNEISLLPRCFLSENHEFFGELFFLLTVIPSKARDELWQFISMLKINPEILANLLDPTNGINYAKAMSQRSLHELLYIMQLIDYLISDVPNQPEATATLYYKSANQFISASSIVYTDSKKKAEDLLKNMQPSIDSPIHVPHYQIVSTPYLLGFNSATSKSDIQTWKENWVQTFIFDNGFKFLLEVLYQMNLATVSQVQPSEKSQLEKDCWNIILKVIRIMLTSSQLANIKEPELAAALSRKLSTNSQKEESVDSPNKQDAPEHSHLIDLMGIYGEEMLEGFDIKAFLQQILQIISMFLNDQSSVSLGFDDKFIIEQCINIWISSITADNTLYYHFFIANEHSTSQIVTQIFIEQGLLCNDEQVRVQFENSLKFICDQIKTPDIRHSPMLQILQVLLKDGELTSKRPLQSKQYFQLLKYLLKTYFRMQSEGLMQDVTLFNQRELLESYIDRLINYQSQERKGNNDFEDHNLISFIQIITDLYSSDPQSLTAPYQEALINELIGSCLFYTKPQSDEDVIMEQQTEVSASELNSTVTINKCQSTTSRTVASALMQLVCQKNPKMISGIIGHHMSIVVKKMIIPKNLNFSPESEGNTLGYQGLVNQGNTCYMNSILQQLFLTPQFRYHILPAQDGKDPEYVEFKGDQVDDNMLHQFLNMLAHMELSDRSAFNTANYCHSYKDYGERIRVGQQQDAQEFLVKTLAKIEESLKNNFHHFAPNSIFGGRTSAVRTCQNCGSMSEREEEFQTIPLEVKNQSSIFDGLKRFTTGEEISGFKCEACNQNADITRMTAISKMPNYLFLHLQRLVFDMEEMQNVKINSRIEFPNQLNLKPYTKGEVFKEKKEKLENARKDELQKAIEEAAKKQVEANGGIFDEEAIAEQIKQVQARLKEMVELEDEEGVAESDATENYDYKLVGAVLHSGSADFGHYVSIGNVERGQKSPDQLDWMQTEKDRWLKFNDNRVGIYDCKNLESDCFGWNGDNDHGVGASFSGSKFNAYILVYEKRIKEDVKILVPSSEIVPASQDESKNLLISRVPALMKSLPEINIEELQRARLMYDPKKDQHYTKVDFNSIKKNIPQYLSKKVHEDNESFLIEKYMFNPGFIESTKAMMDLMIRQDPFSISEENPHSAGIFSFVEKLVFEILPWGKKTQEVQELTKILINILSQNKAQSLSFIEKRVLKRNEKGEVDNDFFKKLITGTPDIRESRANFILHSLKTTIGRHDCKPIFEETTNQLLALLPGEIIDNWSKMRQYFWVLYELVISCDHEYLDNFLQKGLITKMLDFLLENESLLVRNGTRQPLRSSMGNINMKPDYEHLVKLFTYILLKYPSIDLTKISSNDDQEMESPARRVIAPSPVTSFNRVTGYIPLKLTLADRQMLEQRSFYTKLFNVAQDNKELTKLFAHLSFENPEISRRIVKLALVSLNSATDSSMEGPIRLLGKLLSLNDSVRQLRYEQILGFPQPRVLKDADHASSLFYKMGTNINAYIDDQVTVYHSTAFKLINKERQSLLQLLYTARQRWAKFTLEGLISIFSACLEDVSGELYKYLYTLEPPTVQYARYLDWVRPFIKSHIEACKEYSQIKAYQDELPLALQANSLLQRLIAVYPFSGELKKQEEEEALNFLGERRVFGYDPLIDGGTQPYIIISDSREIQLNEKFKTNGVLSVFSYEISTIFRESFPDGKVNRAFPHGQLKSRPEYKVPEVASTGADSQREEAKASSTGGAAVAPYGYTALRGGQMNDNTQRNTTGSNIFTKYGQSTNQINEKKEKKQTQWNNITEYFDGQDNNRQQAHNGPRGKNDSDDFEDEGYPWQNDEEIKGDPQEANAGGFNTPQKGGNTQGSRVNEQKHDVQEFGAGQQPSKTIIKSSNDGNYSVIESPLLKGNTLIVISATLNKSHHAGSQLLTIHFSHGRKVTKPNIRLPQSAITFLVKSTDYQVIFALKKLRFDEDWTDYIMDCQIRPFVKKTLPQLVKVEEPEPNPDFPQVGPNEIQCKSCTVINPKSFTQCSMCDQPLR